MKTIYSQLREIAKKKGWPARFITDLTVHDRAFLRGCKTGDQLIWQVRECGTHLHHTAVSFDRAMLREYPDMEAREFARTAKLNQDWVKCQSEQEGIFYLLHFEAKNYGSVSLITKEKALELTTFNGNRTAAFLRDALVT
jgi:hypothetical protein